MFCNSAVFLIYFCNGFCFFFPHPSQLEISSNILKTSKDSVIGVPPFSHYVMNCKQPTTQQESHRHSGSVLREVSLNDFEERMMSCKRPLLSSTPSLVSKRSLHCLEPSISEISSFSCDELDKPPPLKESMANDLMRKPNKHGTLQESKQHATHTPKAKTVYQKEEHSEYVNTQSKLKLDEDCTCSSTEFVSTQPYIKQLKRQVVFIIHVCESVFEYTMFKIKMCSLCLVIFIKIVKTVITQ